MNSINNIYVLAKPEEKCMWGTAFVQWELLGNFEAVNLQAIAAYRLN